MKATFMQRVLAYFIDVIIISLILSIVTMPINNNRVNELSDELTNKMNDMVNNKEEVNITSLNEELINLEYDIQKTSVIPNVISLLITIAYFIVFQFMNKGKTIGKTLLKIKVIDKNDNEPTLVQMFIRNFIVQGVLTSTISLIAIMIISKSTYINIYFVLNTISSLFIIVCALMILYRKDKMGLHDMMAKTLVVKENE